ncbi:hypothetical protein UPYG_G00243530 [Umbra pygmaea]|uniref:Uncharacterized protein n=1 Tax=Umbra pygmaea TaxID=75934 RepID=A0ABD0X200_UMBPY
MLLASAAWWFGILYLAFPYVTNGSSESQAGPVGAVIGNDVILPCYLKPIPDNIIVEWTRSDQTSGKVHLFKDGQDSDGDQLPDYRGRTSLFNDQLINGNVSLKLSKVTLSDAADYKCSIPNEEGQKSNIKLLVELAKDELDRVLKELEEARKKKEIIDNENDSLAAEIVDIKKAVLIKSVTKVMLIADLLLQNKSIDEEDHEKIRTAGTRHDQMTQLYQVLDKKGEKAKSAFHMILKEQEPDVLKLDAASTWSRGQITGVIIAVIVAVLTASAVV